MIKIFLHLLMQNSWASFDAKILYLLRQKFFPCIFWSWTLDRPLRKLLAFCIFWCKKHASFDAKIMHLLTQKSCIIWSRNIFLYLDRNFAFFVEKFIIRRPGKWQTLASHFISPIQPPSPLKINTRPSKKAKKNMKLGMIDLSIFSSRPQIQTYFEIFIHLCYVVNSTTSCS